MGRRALRCATVVACVLILAAPSSAQEGVSAVTDRGTASEGEQLEVSGRGWAPSSRVTISLCGNDARRGSADCDRPGSRTIVANDDGTFVTELVVVVPPEPCPCVVYVVSDADPRSVRFPIEVLGATSTPTAGAPTGPSTPGFEVTEAELSGRGPWTAWVGGAVERNLSFQLRNVTDHLRTPRLAVTWGSGPSPSHFVEVPLLDPLTPGETVVVNLPVKMDALTIGGFDVVVSVSGAGPSTEVRLSDSSYPWALIAAGAVVGQLLLLRIRNRVRNRLHGSPADRDVVSPPVDEVPAGLDAIPDDAPVFAMIGRLGEPEADPVGVPFIHAPHPGEGERAPAALHDALQEVAREAFALRHGTVERANRMVASAAERQHRVDEVMRRTGAEFAEIVDERNRQIENLSSRLAALERDAATNAERLRIEVDWFVDSVNRALVEIEQLAAEALATYNRSRPAEATPLPPVDCPDSSALGAGEDRTTETSSP